MHARVISFSGADPEKREAAEQTIRGTVLPALRESGPDVVLLADGFSCRTQADQLAGRRGVHLAELLANGRNG